MIKRKSQQIAKARKISLAFTCAVFITISPSLYAQYDFDDINLGSHRAHYNNLPSVEESDTALKASPQFESFLKEAEEVVTRYELESSIGLRLIHRHFTLGENQIMTENYDLVDQIPSLVTQGYSLEEAKEKKAIPASWIISNNSQEPLLFETSTDAVVKTGSLQLQKSPDFFDEMGKLLEEHQLNDLLSVAILKRDTLVAKEGQHYMEINSRNESRSIVQIWRDEEKPSNSIQTSWAFKGPKQQRCWQYTWCLQRPDSQGGHITITSHDKIYDERLKNELIYY
ncbi:MAG: hypothetical protein BGO67_10630 [Alphaproteobacteria bacterium 41-28]|nr:MAG: hypothetical protein BGO67_10630 [Alphaproteobacteria bacterium 41-28]